MNKGLRGESIRVMHPLFQTGEGGATPTSPLQMRVEEIPFQVAKQLNECWHRTLPRLGTGFVENQPFPSFGAVYEGRIFAVAIWSNPVARLLPQKAWLELRRFAIADDAPKNTASWMLGVMTRIFKKQGYEKVISYQDVVEHDGVIYRAAGWTAEAINPNGNWTRQKRPRPWAQSHNPKNRWGKSLINSATMSPGNGPALTGEE